ncbi:helix-turn-helix domain-containing protein [Sphingobacterium sp. UBA6645]|uniref:helix-turn-helix domain-containing protein n=1 Tax=Sphingobacterium sp. UBA6645 TaxID=1947511 RepID=UPI0039C91BE0
MAFTNRYQDPIVYTVCELLNVTQGEIASKSRLRKLSVARCLISYFLRRDTSMSLLEIGQVFGGRDHSTVIYQINQYKDLYATDKHFRSLADKIQSRLVHYDQKRSKYRI